MPGYPQRSLVFSGRRKGKPTDLSWLSFSGVSLYMSTNHHDVFVVTGTGNASFSQRFGRVIEREEAKWSLGAEGKERKDSVSSSSRNHKGVELEVALAASSAKRRRRKQHYGLYLYQWKQSLDDPDSSLASWNNRDTTPCNWAGVTCGPNSSAVTSLDLSNFNVAGPFSANFLCRLPNLTSIILFNNSINQTLPLQISLCTPLLHLDLSQNLLTGTLPYTLPLLPSLRYLDLTGNNFSGPIPPSFGTFQNLQTLSLVFNLLDDVFPPSLFNITSLKTLNLSYNPFHPSPIPHSIGNLTNLETLWLSACNLVGPIPDSVGNLKNLRVLDLTFNNLYGPIPSSLTRVTTLKQIELYNNSLSGELPRGLSNLTSLRLFDVSMNHLSGSIPDELCRLPLESLNLYENGLTGELPPSIADSPNLYELRLFGNKLTGSLPDSLGKSGPLRWVDVSTNRFSGGIPASLCDHGELEEMLMLGNQFSGEIPASLGLCRSLTRVRLGKNRLSGEVPAGMWGLPHVYFLELMGNSFSGSIARTIGGARNLSSLILTKNNFSGVIPEEIGWLENLQEFSGGDNRLSGSLPGSIVNLGQLGTLDLHNNMLSGELPKEIQSWKKLNDLNLANNVIGGEIPDGIGSLTVMNFLDLSNNQFSGNVPTALQNLKLNQLNLSYNRLSGKLPPLLAKDMYRASFIGNPGLCGDFKGLCDGKNGDKSKGFVWILRAIFIVATLVFVVGVVWFYLRYKNFKNAERSVDKSKWTLMSFHKLGFSEDEILNCLDEDNVIGSGSSGKVYKVVLTSGEVVAVKKIWSGVKKEVDSGDVERGQFHQDNAFDAEVETLGKIRHKNIVKLWCCCTTRDSKLLVYEYMPNEYAYTLRVNEKSDIYSFGVVVLELVTGRRPIDPEFGEKDLVMWACTTLDQKGVEHVIDSRLDSCFKEEICKVLNIGLMCTSPLPINRPAMRRVVKMLQEVGTENLTKPANKEGKLSPYYYDDGSDHGSLA
ncbi:hypothetical protein V8G54_033698 [Vigna mungo]|uniref:non-specific serine/threonine protein kinase n=1 Tax=Vigna mungo TaxID=3915 RepID=A0AAQ3MPE1_VIGMU